MGVCHERSKIRSGEGFESERRSYTSGKVDPRNGHAKVSSSSAICAVEGPCGPLHSMNTHRHSIACAFHPSTHHTTTGHTGREKQTRPRSHSDRETQGAGRRERVESYSCMTERHLGEQHGLVVVPQPRLGRRGGDVEEVLLLLLRLHGRTATYRRGHGYGGCVTQPCVKTGSARRVVCVGTEAWVL